MSFRADIFRGQRFAMVGLGRNGLPVARALGAMGAAVVVWDDNDAARKAAMAEGLTVADPEMTGLNAVVLSPGIPHRLPKVHPIAARAIAAGVPILSDADLLFRAVRASGSRARFAGITGTNGKSTTTALLAHMLSKAGRPVAAGGNLGTPALALDFLPDEGVYVLEMSSYMLERIATLRFSAACMLNLSADHIDRHGDMAGYALAKRAIFDRQTAEDVAVIGVDDAMSKDLAQFLRDRPARVVTVSGAGPADFAPDGNWLRDVTGRIADLASARALPGPHNMQNAAAASAMALALGVSRADIAAAIADYPGLPHRQERVGEIDGVSFINDSKATNADSTAWALGCYDKVIWIAGGMAKEGGIEELARFFPRVALALLIGRDAPVLAETLAAHGVPYRAVETLEAATAQGWQAARDGVAPVVLLSPACASWDQFTGFDQRGDRFRDLVREIARGRPS